MEKNVGKIDKGVRFVAGLILIYLAFILDNKSATIILASFGAISISESFSGYCGLYKLLKINTNRRN